MSRGKGSAASKLDAYFTAVANQKLPTIRWSLSNIGSLEASTRNPQGMTAFHVACAAGRHKALDMLVNFYARARALREKGWINLPDADGKTPLMVAAIRGSVECVDVLLDVEDKHYKGAGAALLAVKDDTGKTARDYAVRKQQNKVVAAIDYFLAPSEDEADDGEEKVGEDGLTATERKAKKKANFKLSDREQLAADKKAEKAKASLEREQELLTKPKARWSEVQNVEDSNINLKPLCEISVQKSDPSEFDLVMGVSPIDPALWYLNTLNRLELRLPEGILTSIPGVGLAKLSNLQTLILEHNSISELPEEIGALKKLKTLQIANNKLTSLPESIKNCKKLEAVDIGFNAFTDLSPLKPLTNLVTLLCNNNLLTTLDLEWTNLKRLVVLQTKGNPLTFLTVNISECVLLQQLGLADTNVVALPSSISKLKKLKSLDLTNITLQNPKVQKKVSKALDGGKGLKELLKVCEQHGEKKDPVSETNTGGETKEEQDDQETIKKKKKKKKKR
jgi:hypothetical protein